MHCSLQWLPKGSEDLGLHSSWSPRASGPPSCVSNPNFIYLLALSIVFLFPVSQVTYYNIAPLYIFLQATSINCFWTDTRTGKSRSHSLSGVSKRQYAS